MKSNAKIVIQRLQQRLEKKMQQLPQALMNEGTKVFSESFRNQGWEGKKWKPRVNKKNTRPILVGRTRRLINSVRVSGRSANIRRIIWGTDVPYAKMHNEGFDGPVTVKSYKRKSGLAKYAEKHKVKQHTRHVKMPKRQFMGVGPTLRMRLIKTAEKIFKS